MLLQSDIMPQTTTAGWRYEASPGQRISGGEVRHGTAAVRVSASWWPHTRRERQSTGSPSSSRSIGAGGISAEPGARKGRRGYDPAPPMFRSGAGKGKMPTVTSMRRGVTLLAGLGIVVGVVATT